MYDATRCVCVSGLHLSSQRLCFISKTPIQIPKIKKCQFTCIALESLWFGSIWVGLSYSYAYVCYLYFHFLLDRCKHAFCLLHCLMLLVLYSEVSEMATTTTSVAVAVVVARIDVSHDCSVFTCQLRKYNRFLMLTISG